MSARVLYQQNIYLMPSGGNCASRASAALMPLWLVGSAVTNPLWNCGWKKTGQLLPQETGEAAYWETLLESVVRKEFTKRTGIEVTKPSVILQSEEFPFMLARIRGRKSSRPCCDQHKLNQAIKLYTAGQYTVAEIERT